MILHYNYFMAVATKPPVDHRIWNLI